MRGKYLTDVARPEVLLRLLERLAPLVRALSWSKNLLILGQSKTIEERIITLMGRT